jgi:hypothetical protein
MGATVYVGLAVTSHNASASTVAVIDNVRFTGTASTNAPPAVSLIAPATGASYTMPVTVSIAAAATDPEGRMLSVEFYAGSTLISRDTAAPYAASWSPSAAGAYSLTGVASDADGGSAVSAAVLVTVQTTGTGGTPQAIVFAASADHGTSTVTSYVLDVFAAGANPDAATPMASSDLGKPAPAASNEITVDRSVFFAALPPGSYVATVSAVGPGGRARSPSAAFTR